MPAPSRGGGPILADITIATHRHHLAGALDRPPDFKPNDAKASHPGAAVPVTAGDKLPMSLTRRGVEVPDNASERALRPSVVVRRATNGLRSQ